VKYTALVKDKRIFLFKKGQVETINNLDCTTVTFTVKVITYLDSTDTFRKNSCKIRTANFKPLRASPGSNPPAGLSLSNGDINRLMMILYILHEITLM
jgi:hypothetical protein